MSSTLFAGSSRFSADFKSVINRAVSIASLPLTLLQQQKLKLDDQVTALGGISAKVSNLSASLSAIGTSFGASSFTTTLSNASAASVSAGAGASPGSWDLTVDDLGAATVFVVQGFPPVSNPAVDAYTTNATQTLVLDPDPTDGDPAPQVFTLTPANQSMQALVDQINKVAGSKVQASVVNIGTTSSPSWQLSLQSKLLGPVDITLNDGATSAANSVAQRGSSAKYTISGTQVITDSRSITLAPGVSMELKGVTTSPLTVSVSRSNSAIRSALTGFMTAFNSTVAQIDTHRGNKNAALSGSSVLSATQYSLRQLVNSGPSAGGFNSLQDLGVGFDKSGNLILDDAIFAKATAGSGLDKARTFLGSTADSGWLKSASKVLDSLTHSDTGLIGSAITTTGAASKSEAAHIEAQQERIDRLQTDMEGRMAAADAMVAMLEQQASYFNNMFAAMRSNQDSY